jgi:hypothetical protein
LVYVAVIFSGRRCGINVGNKCRGGQCSWGYMVVNGCWVCCLVSGIFGEGGHPQTGAGAFVATDYGAAMVDDGAVDLCEGHCASSIVHGDNGE